MSRPLSATEYQERNSVLWNMIRGKLYPGLRKGSGPEIMQELRPSEMQHLHSYLQVRERLLKNLSGLQPGYSGCPLTLCTGSSKVSLSEPLLLRPWNRISSVYDLMIRHEIQMLFDEFARMLKPEDGPPNRFVVLEWYDVQLARLRACQTELRQLLQHEPDEQLPEQWFSSIDKTAHGKLPVFVFYNLRNLLLALLHEAEQQWPESFKEEQAYSQEMLFYEVMDTGLPVYDVLRPADKPPCTRSYCDHSLVSFEEALIELGLKHKDHKGSTRYEELQDMLDDAGLPHISYSRRKRFIRRCELETLKQAHLKKP